MRVRSGTAAEVAALSPLIDGLAPVSEHEVACRLAHAPLILVAERSGRAVGFKAGYDRWLDGSYYSWLGGVLPDHRGAGVASALIDAQEAWCREHGYGSIRVKTRNRFVAMRVVLARNGYLVTELDRRGEDPDDWRLLHEKKLYRDDER